MKVLLVNNGFSPRKGRGAAIFVERLAQWLVADGVQVVVVSANQGNQFGKRQHNGATVYDLPYQPDLENNSEKAKIKAIDNRLSSLRYVITEERPDVAHTNSINRYTTRAWEVIKSLEVPLLHSLLLYDLMCQNGSRYKNGQGTCHITCGECNQELAFNKHNSAAVDAIASISRHVLDQHINQGFFPDATQSRVVYGSPGDLDVKHTPVAKDAPLRCAYLGWLEPGKGVEWLAANIAHLPREGWSLRFAGPGERTDQARLRSMTMSYPHIFFDGYVETPSLLAEIDLLLIPSLWEEPLGLVALEALCNGVPILTSGRGGLSEISKLMPDNAFVFDPDQPEIFHSIMETFIEAPEILRKMGPDCAIKARELFNDAKTCNDYQQIYETLLK